MMKEPDKEKNENCVTDRLKYLEYVKLKTKDEIASAMEKQSAKKHNQSTSPFEAKIYSNRILFSDIIKPNKIPLITEIHFDNIDRILPNDNAYEVTAGIRIKNTYNICSFGFSTIKGYTSFIENIYKARGWVPKLKRDSFSKPIKTDELNEEKSTLPSINSDSTFTENSEDRFIDLTSMQFSETNGSKFDYKSIEPNRSKITYTTWTCIEEDKCKSACSSEGPIIQYHCCCNEKRNQPMMLQEMQPCVFSGFNSVTCRSCITDSLQFHECNSCVDVGSVYSCHRKPPPRLPCHSIVSSLSDQSSSTSSSNASPAILRIETKPYQTNVTRYIKGDYLRNKEYRGQRTTNYLSPLRFKSFPNVATNLSESSSYFFHDNSSPDEDLELNVSIKKAHQYIQNQTRRITGRFNRDSKAPLFVYCHKIGDLY